MAGSIFCNLEKAFNSVNHDLLLSKLPYLLIYLLTPWSGVLLEK